MSSASAMPSGIGAVAIGGRALAIEGPTGSGKSTLALALIDRGASLIGDDGITLIREGDRVIAGPPPNIAGLIEIRGVGIVEVPVSESVPLALILTLGGSPADRLPDEVPRREVLDCPVPVLAFDLSGIAPALRAEWALRVHGLRT